MQCVRLFRSLIRSCLFPHLIENPSDVSQYVPRDDLELDKGRSYAIEVLGPYDVTTIGSPRVTTTVCSKCADGDPSAVLMVHPSSAVTDPPAPLEITGSTAMTSPGQRTLPVPWGIVVWNEGLLVDRPADAVTTIAPE